MVDLSTELQSAAEADVVGLALAGTDRTIQRKIGRMVEWLPAVGADCCQCMLLAGMETEFAELAEGRRDVIALPGVRGAMTGQDEPVTAVVAWNGERQQFVVVAMPDFTARQVETLIGSERRARRLIEQQLEAANSEARYASFARTRLRLARDLHDTLVHSIMALLTQIRLVQHFVTADPAQVADGLATAEEAAISGLTRARDAIARLRMPDDLDTAPEVEEMLADFGQRTGTRISVEIEESARAGLHRHATTIRRILEEALHNIETHAGAGQVSFRAACQPETDGHVLVAEIHDDGRGFDPQVPKPGHFGLLGMAEFAELAGGRCAVESTVGQGAAVRISIPLEAEDALP